MRLLPRAAVMRLLYIFMLSNVLVIAHKTDDMTLNYDDNDDDDDDDYLDYGHTNYNSRISTPYPYEKVCLTIHGRVVCVSIDRGHGLGDHSTTAKPFALQQDIYAIMPYTVVLF